MAEASSGQDLNVLHSKNARTRENGAVAIDPAFSNSDLYKMCKKIAQLTKVIYNLNVKNDELEIYQSRMQHDYEKKMWKLSADVQQHVSNTASLMRTESTRSAEMSQLRAHLDEQISLSESLSEELRHNKQQHEAELSSATDEWERRLAAQRAELAETEAALQAQSDRLTEVETELAAEQAALLRSSQQKDALQQSVLQLERQLREESDRAQTWRVESERAAAEIERAAETETVLRRDLASERQQTDELRSQLDGQQRQLEEARSREQLLNSQLEEQREARDRVTAELDASVAELRDRDDRLSEQDSRLLEQDARLITLSEHLQSRCEQLHSLQAQLEAVRQQTRQQTVEMERLTERLHTVQTEGAAARGRADHLSQLLIARDATISRLESELAVAENTAAEARVAAETAASEARIAIEAAANEVKIATEAKAAATAAAETESDLVTTPVGDVQSELERTKRLLEKHQNELDEARQQLEEYETQREEQSQLMQAALEESAALESECRRRVEALQTVTAEREQQLMDDAETRLREVRRECKRKLEEQQQVSEEQLANLRQTVEAELLSQKKELDERSASVDRKLAEMEALRSFEAEVVQLRGLTHELMRELRVGTRQVELCRTQEARTAEENRRLNELVSKHSSSVTAIQKEQQQLRLQLEQQLRLQADQQRSALDAQWEDRLREERRTLKAELDCLHSEEKHLAVESMRLDREQRLQEAEQCARQLQKQLECAADELREQQTRHQMELEQRERESESVIASLHRQLQAANSATSPEKATGKVVVNGAVDDSDGSTAQSPDLGRSPDPSDEEDGGGDARSRIERALRDRPPLQSALASLLSERDRQVALLRHQLSAAGEQHHSEQAERAAAADRRAELLRQQLTDAAGQAEQLQLQLAAAHGRTEQLLGELAELKQDHERLSEQAASSEREHLSELEAVRVQCRHQVDSLQKRQAGRLARLEAAGHAATERIAALETLAAETADRQRPEDAVTISRLQEALRHCEQQADALRREKQQLGLELANRDASYSRLFPTGAPRVGVIDPTAASGGGGRGPPPAPPTRQQRRPAGRAGRR